MNFAVSLDDIMDGNFFLGKVRGLVMFREESVWEAWEMEILQRVDPNFLILIGAEGIPQSYGGVVFTTARHGAIKIECDGRRFSLSPFLKNLEKQFWGKFY